MHLCLLRAVGASVYHFAPLQRSQQKLSSLSHAKGHTFMVIVWCCSYVLSCTTRALTRCCVCCAAVQEKRVLNLSGRLAKLPLKVCGRQDTQAHVPCLQALLADDEHLKFYSTLRGHSPSAETIFTSDNLMPQTA